MKFQKIFQVKETMSLPGLLSLKWNNHSNRILQLLNNLQNKNQYEDATVACGGKMYPVHRFVLSACSSYFEEMFAQTHSNGKHSIIVLKDIPCDVFESLLSYMYAGRVEVKKEKLGELINAAACLEIKGLAVSEEYERQPIKKSRSLVNSIKRSVSQIHSSNLCDNEHPSKVLKVNHSPSIIINEPSVISQNEMSLLSMPAIENSIDKINTESMNGGESHILQENESSGTNGSSSEHDITASIVSNNKCKAGVPCSDTLEAVMASLSDAEDAEADTAVFDFDAPETSVRDDLQLEQEQDTSCGSDQIDSPEMASLSTDVSNHENEDCKGSITKQQACAVNTLEQNLCADYVALTAALRAKNLPIFQENGTGSKQIWQTGSDSSADVDMRQNFDIYSMLDLHYDEAGESAALDDPELAAVLSSNAKSDSSPILRQQWQCPQCDYSTPVKQYITQHIRRHTGEKPFKCNLCDYRAAQKQSVTYHMRRHTGEKPHKCPHCSYCSSSRQNLDRHVRRHTGEMPYGCPYCGYRSITKGPVVDHMRAKHGERDCDKALVVKLDAKSNGSLMQA